MALDEIIRKAITDILLVYLSYENSIIELKQENYKKAK